MNFAVSYSGGKDSALALHRMIGLGHTPVALLTTVNMAQKRSWFHGIEAGLLHAVAGSLGLPLIVCACAPDGYARAFERGLAQARQMGAQACVFGDIDIAEHRQWNQARCAAAGLECALPLWNQEREALVREVIGAGFKAMIKTVQSGVLDASFLGQDLSLALLDKMKAAWVDVCGENGEYHTFVHDGPAMQRPVAFEKGEVIDFGTHLTLNIFAGRGGHEQG